MGVVPGLKPSLPRVGGGVGHVCWRWEEWSREEGGQLTGLLSIVSVIISVTFKFHNKTSIENNNNLITISRASTRPKMLRSIKFN